MESKEPKQTHGGARANSGRMKRGRNIALSVRISQKAHDYLEREVKNKSAFIDHLVIREFEGEM